LLLRWSYGGLWPTTIPGSSLRPRLWLG